MKVKVNKWDPFGCLSDRAAKALMCDVVPPLRCKPPVISIDPLNPSLRMHCPMLLLCALRAVAVRQASVRAAYPPGIGVPAAPG